MSPAREFGTGLRLRVELRRRARAELSALALDPPVEPEPWSPELALVSPEPAWSGGGGAIAAALSAGEGSGPRPLPLGALIVESGLLPLELVERALVEAAQRRKRLGEVLAEGGYLDQRDVIRLVAGQYGLPFLDLALIEVDHGAARLLPEVVARRLRTLPVGFARGLPVVAVADPTDELALQGTRSVLHCVRFAVSAEEELLAELARVYA